MRKRERDAIAKQLKELADGTYQNPVQQLFGGEWYFANGAEIKGFNCAHAALSWLEKYSKDLKALIKRATKIYDNEFKRKNMARRAGRRRNGSSQRRTRNRR